MARDDTYGQPATGPTIVSGPGVLANDTIPCGGAVVKVTRVPAYGDVMLQPTNGGFVYTPASSPSKADWFTYEVCTGTG